MPERLTLHRLNGTGLIAFSGEDAATFLQGQLSCDVAALSEAKATYGSYCTPKGRLLASFLLWRTAAEFYMQLPTSLRESIQKRLSMYILRAKVKAEDASERYARFGVAGKGAAALIEAVVGTAPAATHDVTVHEGTIVIRLPGDRFEVVAPIGKSDSVYAALRAHADEAPQELWEWLDIRAGVPWITPETQEAFVPQMVNLDLIGGVSFSKGCYPGQEIVARMHYRGQVKQRMHLAHIAAPAAPVPGDKLYGVDMGDQASGMIVNATAAPTGGYDVLAAIQTSSVEAGDVRLGSRDGPALEFLPPPH